MTMCLIVDLKTRYIFIITLKFEEISMQNLSNKLKHLFPYLYT